MDKKPEKTNPPPEIPGGRWVAPSVEQIAAEAATLGLTPRAFVMLLVNAALAFEYGAKEYTGPNGIMAYPGPGRGTVRLQIARA